MRDNQVGAAKGAVVAIDPRTGAIQAMVSMPSFDPNPLVAHDTKAAREAYQELEQHPDRPLRNRALAERYPPGSVFKVIDAAAALERGYTPTTLIPAGPTYQHPETTHVIRNAAPSICPEAQVSLIDALTESCNTGFARLAVELGADVIAETARAFGFDDPELTVGRLDGDGMPVAESRTGALKRDDGIDDGPVVALRDRSGERRDHPAPGAMIAAAVAQRGADAPLRGAELQHGPDLSRLCVASPQQRPALAGCGRRCRNDGQRGQHGTGRNAAIAGLVGGKTGTAQTGQGRPTMVGS